MQHYLLGNSQSTQEKPEEEARWKPDRIIKQNGKVAINSNKSSQMIVW